jgi:hypothetical protein
MTKETFDFLNINDDNTDDEIVGFKQGMAIVNYILIALLLISILVFLSSSSKNKTRYITIIVGMVLLWLIVLLLCLSFSVKK